MWSLLDVLQPHLAATSGDIALWLFCWLACTLAARARGYSPYPFTLVGLLLGLPGLVLTMVATAFFTPPSRAIQRKLRLASVWAEDPLLRDKIDEEEVEGWLDAAYPALLGLYKRACKAGLGHPFVRHLRDYMNAEDSNSADLFVYLSVAVFGYMALRLALLKTVEVAGPILIDAPAITWIDALVPTVLYIAVRSGRLGFFSTLLRMQHQRHLYSLAALALGSGTDASELRHVLVGHDLTDDPDSLSWLEGVPHDVLAERAATEEAERLTLTVRTTLSRLANRLVPLYFASVLVYCFTFVHASHWFPSLH